MADAEGNDVEKKILVQYKESRKIVSASSLQDLKRRIQEVFSLHAASILVQKYNAEFGEAVDVDHFREISNGDQLQVVVMETAAEPKPGLKCTQNSPTGIPSQSCSMDLPTNRAPAKSGIIHHPLPVQSGVKPALRKINGGKSRTVFTDLQLRVLEKTFSEQRYLDSTNRAKLSHILGLKDAQVKTWFQNRRMKWKKKMERTGEKPDSPTTY